MKILTIHASAGAGHLKAAEAVYDGLKESTEHDIVNVDALDYSSPAFKSLYRGTYIFLITYIPALWAFFFGLLDIPWIQRPIRKFRRIYNKINTKKLHQFLIDEQFDVIYSMHFMPNEVASALKRSGKIRSKIICCVTDYDVHKIWLADGIDYYCVACEWTLGKMVSLGVPSSKIKITGIPANQKFTKSYDRTELKNSLGLLADEFTVLIATGSFGIGPIEQIVDELKGSNVQAIVVCGHNKDLFQRLSQRNEKYLKVFGLVDNMHELMAVSDVMVTKPGGLSITEALVTQLPLIFFNAIPGQETNNVKILNEYGIGISGCSIKEIAQELVKYKNSRDAYFSALNNTKRLSHPNAVKDVIALIP